MNLNMRVERVEGSEVMTLIWHFLVYTQRY